MTFNGGDGDATHAAGSGGIFTVNTTGVITVGSPIQATTGFLPSSTEPSGAGGTVNLTSSGGTVAVNSPILVSSAETTAAAPPPPLRRSRSGGNINLRSDAGTGVAINVSNTGQLLSLLDAAAPGPGGKITILATGASSQINATGGGSPGKAPPDSIAADRGTVDIRHTGLNGQINLTNSNIRADIVKVAALGDNGSINITGGGTISADSILRLYATGANGQVNFLSNVTLGGNSAKIIGANSVTVSSGVTVTVGGNRQVDVYVLDPNKANYSASNGGNGSTTGVFTLFVGGSPTSGAVTHPGATPPPLDGP